jgi:hypothetical protein
VVAANQVGQPRPQNSERLGFNANGTPANIIPPNAGLGIPNNAAPISSPGQNSEVNGYNANGTPASSGYPAPAGVGGPPPVTPVPLAKPAAAPATAPSAGQNFLTSLSDYLNQSGTTPGASDYLGQFQSSLAAARGNIQQQLAAAMGDIANNQASATRQLGTLPGSINQSFGQEGGLVNNAAGAIAASQAANGISANPTAGSNSKAGFGMNESNAAENAPEQLAMQNTKNADLANVPLLQQGIVQQGNTMRDAANMAALGDLSNLDVTGAQGALQAGMAQAQAQQTAQDQKNQFLQNILLNQQQDNAALAQQAANGNSALTAVAPGVYGTAGLTVGQVQSAHQSPNYTNSIAALQNGSFSQTDYNRLQRSFPTLFTVLNTEFNNTPAWTKAKTASLSASGK